jgi:hypothetical protein
MNPRLIITLVGDKLFAVADGTIDVYVETANSTIKYELETIPREDLTELLLGKIQEDIIP